MNVINGAINKKDVDSVTTFIRYRSYKYSNLELGEEVNVQILVRQKRDTCQFPKEKGLVKSQAFDNFVHRPFLNTVLRQLLSSLVQSVHHLRHS